MVTNMKKSNKTTAQFHSLQVDNNLKQLSLVQSCPTRWNSTFLMLQRINQNKAVIQSIYGIRTNEGVQPSNSKKEKKRIKLQLTEKEWKISSDLEKILQPLNQFTTVIQGFKIPTISVLAPLVVHLMTVFNDVLSKWNLTLEGVSTSILDPLLPQLVPDGLASQVIYSL